MVRHRPLRRKLWRDLRGNAMQFLAMFLLCVLGTWVFAGLDATWRMQEATIETYLKEQNLADFWVRAPALTAQDIRRIRNIPGISDMVPRITLEMDLENTDDKVTAAVHAVRGPMTVNTPVIRTGEALHPQDIRGCLVEEQFALARGLAVGDTVSLKLSGTRQTYDFQVRGTVLEPEYLVTARDMAPDPATYGFVLISSDALPMLDFNDLQITLSDPSLAGPAEQAIRDIVPEAIIVTQATHGATQQGRNYINLFQKMSYLFPSLAYFVAALIVITTISRMMDSQRTQMGTLKALGYTNRQIRGHYIFYALLPSLLGSAIGLFVAQFTLPQIIWKMAATNMRTPCERLAPISALSWFMAALEVVLSVLICIRHINRSARESTAELLRPKPPRSGTRVPLERIPALWQRFSFNTKMIVRNLFRARGRTLLSMVGMLFCNMLIICSFGLQESIPFFINEYFTQTLRYDVRADLDPAGADTLEAYRNRIRAQTVDGLMEQSVTFRTPGHTRAGLLTVLPDDVSLVCLSEEHGVLPLPSDGAVMMPKLAELLGLSPGDEFEMWLTGRDKPVRLTLRGYATSNIGQTAYMSERAWKGLREGSFRPSALLLRGLEDSGQNLLDQLDEVTGFKYPPDQYRQTMKIMESASTAFSVLSGVALGLAFVICYNMGLLSFTERTRDYATLKVLGYHQREIRSLMLRENNLTAVFGVAAGIWPGILLVRVILKMCEFDSMVFVPHITLKTILLSSAVTFAFTFLIELLLTRKVKSIDMVEALKSVE